MAPHLQRYQGLAVNYYSCTLYALDLQHPRLLVAVGMRVASHPPHRSQRAELPHWAPTSGSDVHAQVRVWMTNAGPWEPAVNESVHSFPVEAMALATTKQRFVPKTTHMEVK